MHVGEIHAYEKRLVRVLLPLADIGVSVRDVVLYRFHPLLGERPGTLADLFAELAKAAINRGVVLIGSLTVQNASRPVLGFECTVFRIVRQFWLFIPIQVIEAAIEFIEAM